MGSVGDAGDAGRRVFGFYDDVGRVGKPAMTRGGRGMAGYTAVGCLALAYRSEEDLAENARRYLKDTGNVRGSYFAV